MPLRLRGAGDGKAVCFHPVTEGTGTTRQPAFMGLCPKPRSLSNRGEWLQGKRPLPGARFPSWEPIAPSGLLGLLSSRALSVPAVGRTRNIRRKDARAIGESLKESTFAQFNSVHFCSARYTKISFQPSVVGAAGNCAWRGWDSRSKPRLPSKDFIPQSLLPAPLWQAHLDRFKTSWQTGMGEPPNQYNSSMIRKFSRSAARPACCQAPAR